MKKYAIGIDIGGTKIKTVIGTSKGKILAERRIPTLTGSKSKTCVKNLIASVKSLVKESGIPKRKIAGIGVGCPGAVDSKKGIIPRSPNLPGWKGIPLRKLLQKAIGLPVRFANDANAAALGESVFGAGKRAKDFIYITVSTGVGGGIVIDGRLYEGSSFAAGEIGHMNVVPEGEKCPCGKRGCLEAYASGTAIANFVRERMPRSGTKIRKFLPKHKKLSAKEVGMAVSAGDKLAIKSYERAGYYLGIGIASLLNILNPDTIVIGGGILHSPHGPLWRAMMQSAKEHAWPETFCAARIVRSKLLGKVGDLGALALAFKK